MSLYSIKPKIGLSDQWFHGPLRTWCFGLAPFSNNIYKTLTNSYSPPYSLSLPSTFWFQAIDKGVSVAPGYHPWALVLMKQFISAPWLMDYLILLMFLYFTAEIRARSIPDAYFVGRHLSYFLIFRFLWLDYIFY